MSRYDADLSHFDSVSSHRSPVSEESWRAGLSTAVELLTFLEKEISEVRVLLERLVLDPPASICSSDAGPPSVDAPTILPDPTRGNFRTPLSLCYFGQFEAYCGGHRLIQRRVGKGRAILQYLAFKAPQRVPCDVLIQVLWPGATPHVAKNRLRVAMHHLRHAFASSGTGLESEDFVLFQDGSYLINPRFEVWTDVDAFERNWRSGLQFELAGKPDDAVPFYREAEALYRGDFLEEDLLEDWTLAQREELKDIYLTILERLSCHWAREGNTDGAIQGWKKILAKDPWREDIYRKLIAQLAASGQRANALHWYEQCVLALREHLDVEPEAETLTLYRNIRGGAAASVAAS